MKVEFEYTLKEIGVEDIDLNPTLSRPEQEILAINELKKTYPDLENIKILSIKEYK